MAVVAASSRQLEFGHFLLAVAGGIRAIPSGWRSFSPRLRGTSYPGSCPINPINLEKVESIPHILFIKRDLVTPQQLAEFILKRGLPMMFLLSGDICPHRLDLGKADGENAVAILP